jgi:hypothetical protein
MYDFMRTVYNKSARHASNLLRESNPHRRFNAKHAADASGGPHEPAKDRLR